MIYIIIEYRRGAVKFPNKAVVNITSRQPLNHYRGGVIYIAEKTLAKFIIMAQLLPSIPPQLKAQIKEIFDQFSEFCRMENKRRSADERKKKRQQKWQESVEGKSGPAGRAGGIGDRESISSPAVECKEECTSETVKDYSYEPYQPLGLVLPGLSELSDSSRS
jgi:hypothetical protein